MTQLQTTLRQLRLSGLVQTLPTRLQEAAANRLGHGEFLELILQDELNVRHQRMLARRTKAAEFRASKPWKTSTGTSIPPSTASRFTNWPPALPARRQRRSFSRPARGRQNPSGQALGYEAIKQGKEVLYRSIFDLVRDFMKEEAFKQQDKTLRNYLKPDLVIIDDMGLKALPKHSGEYLLEVIMRRYENRSTIMTSNRPLEDWGKLLSDVPTAGAILDRFLITPRSLPSPAQLPAQRRAWGGKRMGESAQRIRTEMSSLRHTAAITALPPPHTPNGLMGAARPNARCAAGVWGEHSRSRLALSRD